MVRLVTVGIISALFFSSTFVLNRAMSLAGGYWAWTASLRFGYMLLFLGLIVLLRGGMRALRQVWEAFWRNWLFWMAAGGIGFGVFYAMICFSSEYSAGWIVATTWQTTILATPLVLAAFGRKIPPKGLVFSGVIFVGIMLVNLEHAAQTSLAVMLSGALPAVVAAFAYPIGNQLVWEARRGENPRLPHITDDIVGNSFARVLLLTMGSVPFWLVLLAITRPPAPTPGQYLSTALVALFSGVIATTIFLYARQQCHQPYEISAVDATQAMEVVFSLAGEIIFLQGAIPGTLGLAGLGLTILGLGAYMLQQNK